MNWDEDALFVGRRICERLVAEVPALREVSMIDELKGPEPAPRQWPAAVVLLHSMRPVSAEPVQQRIPVEQMWLVMLAVRSARADADRTSTEVGRLIAPVVKALQGWAPPDTRRLLTWAPGPRPDYSRDTSYYPLMWRIQLATT